MQEKFMQEAIQLAKESMNKNTGGPFGAVIVYNNEIIGRGHNQVISKSDPTAHGEILAIRDACKSLGTPHLNHCEIYSSCEPCPMCLGAIYWSRLSKIYFACGHADAADSGFDDSYIYQQINIPFDRREIPTVQMMREEALVLFRSWDAKPDRKMY